VYRVPPNSRVSSPTLCRPPSFLFTTKLSSFVSFPLRACLSLAAKVRIPLYDLTKLSPNPFTAKTPPPFRFQVLSHVAGWDTIECSLPLTPPPSCFPILLSLVFKPQSGLFTSTHNLLPLFSKFFYMTFFAAEDSPQLIIARLDRSEFCILPSHPQ